jgi:hypothetical protein
MALEEPEQQASGSGVPQLQQQPLIPNAAADQHGNVHSVKLPEFWPHAPAMWFARAECRFEIMRVAGERQKFCCMADALPYEQLRLVADLVASLPEQQPYTVLKERLLLARSMTATQRAEKLFSMPPLGGRLPSDLLTAMFEYCPPGEETSELLKALFLTRLPPEIRVLLEHLPWVLLGLRAARKESADVSAAEVVYGIPLTLPGQHGRPAERDSWPEIPST